MEVLYLVFGQNVKNSRFQERFSIRQPLLLHKIKKPRLCLLFLVGYFLFIGMLIFDRKKVFLNETGNRIYLPLNLSLTSPYLTIFGKKPIQQLINCSLLYLSGI